MLQLKEPLPNRFYVQLNLTSDAQLFIDIASEKLSNTKFFLFIAEWASYIFIEGNDSFESISDKLSSIIPPDLIFPIQNIIDYDDQNFDIFFMYLPEKYESNDILEESKFEKLVSIFIPMFKCTSIINNFMYSVHCQSLEDMIRLVSFLNVIQIQKDSRIIFHQKIIELPIVEIFVNNIQSNKNPKNIIPKDRVSTQFFDMFPDYFQIYDFKVCDCSFDKNVNLILLKDAEKANELILKTNGGKIINRTVYTRHFIDQITRKSLFKYTVKTDLDLMNDLSAIKESLGIENDIYFHPYENNKIGTFSYVTFYDQKHADTLIAKGLAKFWRCSFYIANVGQMNEVEINRYLTQKKFPPKIFDMTKTNSRNNCYFVEGYDKSFSIFKIHYRTISEIDGAIESLQKEPFYCNNIGFQPFCIKNLDEFNEAFRNIASNNTFQVTGIAFPKNAQDLGRSEITEIFGKYGIMKLLLLRKMNKTETYSALVGYSKAKSFDEAKSGLNQLIFHDHNLNIIKYQESAAFQFRVRNCNSKKETISKLPVSKTDDLKQFKKQPNSFLNADSHSNSNSNTNINRKQKQNNKNSNNNKNASQGVNKNVNQKEKTDLKGGTIEIQTNTRKPDLTIVKPNKNVGLKITKNDQRQKGGKIKIEKKKEDPPKTLFQTKPKLDPQVDTKLKIQQIDQKESDDSNLINEDILSLISKVNPHPTTSLSQTSSDMMWDDDPF
ncbi:hypothetical protein TRFO_21088 [Tritrichomonas foetus]|uniref:RRM domain-containing protein n=1 Tax=Tritrichomonas foetus TaxID=1144522 RepID=A0A1J4KJF6_9EUKA|nr:hypothetical protein TRFO_21088 [Tritrichomonas foetus]|eukprot:OHT09822.1 hypothetical protein TRFO_21088 [Tritrichomonas foetus]